MGSHKTTQEHHSQHTHMRTHTRTHMHTCAHRHTRERTHRHTCAHICAHTQAHVFTYQHTRAHVLTQAHVHICTHVHRHARTYTARCLLSAHPNGLFISCKDTIRRDSATCRPHGSSHTSLTPSRWPRDPGLEHLPWPRESALPRESVQGTWPG